MKKALFLASLLFLPFSLVLAVGGSQSPKIDPVQGQATSTQNSVQSQQGSGVQVQTQEQVQQGEGEQVQTQNQEQVGQESPNVQVKAGNATQLREMVETKAEELDQEASQVKDATAQKVYKNQNAVREAVHSLLAAENVVGGIGQQVSQIARDFNNSVDKTIKAEEKIQNRNVLTRMFVGGDKQAAAELEQEVSQNRARIQTLNQLMQNCNCDSETKAVLQEQIQNMEQEQNRLESLSKEQQANGLFGWLVQLFK